jgi:hypothetical protein
MAPDANQAASLAAALRNLRESTWPDHVLTQAQLAEALSSEGRVAPATLNSWESKNKPKAPSVARIRAYARFFCTQRSLEGGPHLIPEDELEPAELERFRALEAQLLEVVNPEDVALRRSFQFDAGPVVVICPEAPVGARGPLADEHNINFTKLQKYGDLDALVELYGHSRAENPTHEVFHRLASEVASDDLSGHVIVLGGIGWNIVTRDFQAAIEQLPIKQTAVDDLKEGDIFRVETYNGARSFYPKYEDRGEGKEVVEDVGYLARLPHPFRANRTLTLCNGIHSRGVFGAVRCLTDATVRDGNEKYLGSHFPDGYFAILFRVPVVGGETVSPDLQKGVTRLYEWAPSQDAPR